MNRHWNLLVEPLLRAAEPRAVCEIGAAQGAQTALLLGLCEELHAVADVVDPAPDFDAEAWKALYGSVLRFHHARSLEVIPRLSALDAVLIDGDHNWFTVYHELLALEEASRAAGSTPPLILLHDVGWPYGRRDMYYAPDAIPERYRQPHGRVCLHPQERGHLEAGLNGHLQNALEEGGPRNGVRTAVEDFLQRTSETWRFTIVGSFHGLGVLVPSERAPSGSTLHRAIRRLDSVSLLKELVTITEGARVQAEVAAQRWHSSALHAASTAQRVDSRSATAKPESDLTANELESVRHEAATLRQELQAALEDIPSLLFELLDVRYALALERERRERTEHALVRQRLAIPREDRVPD